MTIADVMTTRVEKVRPTLPALSALELMRRRRIHHLVVTEASRVLGIVSDRDGDAVMGTALLADSSVADIMSSDVAVIEPTAPVSKAAALMRRRRIGCLPVVAGRRLVGILTRSDLLDLIASKRIG